MIIVCESGPWSLLRLWTWWYDQIWLMAESDSVYVMRFQIWSYPGSGWNLAGMFFK